MVREKAGPFDVDDTIVRAPSRSASPVPAGPGAANVAGPGDLDDTVLTAPAKPAAEAPPRGRAHLPVADRQRVCRFRIAASGQIVDLDRPVYVGRRPAAPRVGTGAELLVTVPSPQHEVSATHLELRQSGSVVVATDLGSTNGTRLAIPGRVPELLRSAESAVVTAGTRIDLGDGVLLEILPPAALR